MENQTSMGLPEEANNHGDNIIAFRMKIRKIFKKSMERQLYESIKIINSKTEDDFLLNSKS